MSLFGGFFGMNDPFMMMREMDSMATAMMRGAFPMMNPMLPQAMNPFAFPSTGGMFGQMQSHGNCQVFSSSSFTTVTTGPDGRPMVYQASSSSRTGPGGARETRKTVTDSRTGVRKMAIGRHLGDRGHILEKEQNVHTGETEEKEDLINLEEEEAPEFDRQWEQRARGPYRPRHVASIGGYEPQVRGPLAITAGPSGRSQYSYPPERERSSGKYGDHRSGKRQRTNKQ